MLKLDLSFEKVYVEMGEYYMDQLVGSAYFKGQTSEEYDKVLQISIVIPDDSVTDYILRFNSIDIPKDKGVHVFL